MPYAKTLLPEYPYKSDMWDLLKTEKRPIVVYGMGNGADKLIKRLAEYDVEISDFFASDGFVRGHSFHGKRVKSFSEIKSEYSDFVILLSFASNRDEVLDMLEKIDSEFDMLVPDMPVAGENEYFDREFYNANYSKIIKAYDSLADDDSKNAFASIINYKLTGKMKYLMSAFSTKDEMYSLMPKDVSSYVDVGAYNGDTLFETVKYFPCLDKAVAIEPDPKNFKKLEKNAANLKIDLTLFNAAAWSKCLGGVFTSSGNRNSSVNSTASFEHKQNEVELITVDSAVSSFDDLRYIKYDVEGAEQEAILGSAYTIEKYTPVLLISLYHRSRDIFELINYVNDNWGSKYGFYLRRLKCTPAWEINLICVPLENPNKFLKLGTDNEKT